LYEKLASFNPLGLGKGCNSAIWVCKRILRIGIRNLHTASRIRITLAPQVGEEKKLLDIHSVYTAIIPAHSSPCQLQVIVYSNSDFSRLIGGSHNL